MTSIQQLTAKQMEDMVMLAGAMCSHGAAVQHGADSAGWASVVRGLGHAACPRLSQPHAGFSASATPHAHQGHPLNSQ